jgi:hypothetical protein
MPPTDDNPAAAHLSWHRQMSGVPEPRADAAQSVRRDNATPTSEPVAPREASATPIVGGWRSPVDGKD